MDRNLLIKFAFEQEIEDVEEEIIAHIANFSSLVDLVIIGYSFPLSNRNIDLKVFESILNKVEYTSERIINLSVHIQVLPASDGGNDQFSILKNKIIGLINTVNPELTLSADGNELTHVKVIQGSGGGGGAYPAVSGVYSLPKDREVTLKIKFFKQIDPDNFYIPQSF